MAAVGDATMINNPALDRESFQSTSPLRRLTGICARAVAVAAIVAGLTACAGQTTKHGQFYSDQELAQVQPGMSADQVKGTLGTPSTTSTIDGQVYYYISSTSKKSIAFMSSSEIDRRVVAIYFDQLGQVERIANYGLKDGVIFDYITRETPTQLPDKGLLGQLFRGVGQQKVFDGSKPQ